MASENVDSYPEMGRKFFVIRFLKAAPWDNMSSLNFFKKLKMKRNFDQVKNQLVHFGGQIVLLFLFIFKCSVLRLFFKVKGSYKVHANFPKKIFILSL